ncbi:unnamed protein product [Spodoptera exigua]|nr:unnamed protein product [Spodoptera exigua]
MNRRVWVDWFKVIVSALNIVLWLNLRSGGERTSSYFKIKQSPSIQVVSLLVPTSQACVRPNCNAVVPGTIGSACRIAPCVRRVALVSPPVAPCRLAPDPRYKCYKCLLLQFRPGLRSGVRTVDVQAVEGMVAQFPCDLGTAANDKVYMVFWFRDDAGIPLYSLFKIPDTIFTSKKLFSKESALISTCRSIKVCEGKETQKWSKSGSSATVGTRQL